MICVIQRVNKATVYADGVLSGEIGKGLYLLLGVAGGDTSEDVLVLAEKISKLRIFTDSLDKMNLSVNDISGEVMVVSNFTLNANYKKGNRPDYLNSAPPAVADTLYEEFKVEMAKRVKKVASGRFGADMKTEMETDGPVTIVMDSAVLLKKG